MEEGDEMNEIFTDTEIKDFEENLDTDYESENNDDIESVDSMSDLYPGM